MSNIIRRHKYLTTIILILLIIVIGFAIYSSYRKEHVSILDRTEFNELNDSILALEETGGFESQASLRDFITSWADSKGLEYKIDKYDNIIFRAPAVERKKNVSPSVVCVSYNYQTAIQNSRLLASAAMIAGTELDSGKKTVIFFNDEQNDGKGYRGISKKLLSGKSKIIYLDYGASSYLSTESYARSVSRISIPAAREEIKCDTVVKVHIGGIVSDEINTGISKHPDPIFAFGTLLARLKSKSTIYQLADFSVGSNGSMYPVSLDATFVLNSYSVASFTKYIDNRIKAWNKAYGDDYPDFEYTYEVIDDPAAFPESAYTSATASKLANVLYTVKSGSYKFSKDDTIPEGREEGDSYGFNFMTGLTSDDEHIYLRMLSQAYDAGYLERINSDNNAAASLFKCKFAVTDSIEKFTNDKDSLSRTLIQTFYKINDISGISSVLEMESDNYFTPCSYLAAKSASADIVHLRLNERRAANLTNLILVYISTKGNLISL
ncbi:MAG: hypothetical protein IKE85_09245 [Mogibacterium sp.]|nr:hypothetical protein [Mogibacterium sp.]